MATQNLNGLTCEVLSALHQRMGFDLWMVSRVRDDEYVVLQVHDHGYGIIPGTVLSWPDSLCHRMVLDKCPAIAPAVDDVDLYARAPIREQLAVEAYAGVPLLLGDGSLFGTLCAIHPHPLPESVREDLPLIAAVGKLLSATIEARMRRSSLMRYTKIIESEALIDSLTGVYNRRAWERFMLHAEERCMQEGISACVIIIDLDNFKHINDTQGHLAGDDYLRLTAQAIQAALRSRSQDHVARLGGDEFAVLCLNCGHNIGIQIVQRIEASLAQHSIKASVGLSVRNPLLGLLQAWREADSAMYVHKQSKSLSR